MSITLDLDKKINNMETAWNMGVYPLACYWSRQITQITVHSRKNPDNLVNDCFLEYAIGIKAKYQCWDAIFYWKNYKLAKQALDDYIRHIKNDEQETLRQEIEIRETEERALQQLNSGDPFHPQNFTTLVATYPKGRPNQERFLTAVDDYKLLQFHHALVLSAKTFSQFAERLQNVISSARETIWKQYFKIVINEWNKHFDSLCMENINCVHEHLISANFEQAETAFTLLKKQYEIVTPVLNPLQPIEDILREIQLSKEKWKKINQDITIKIREYQFEDAKRLIDEYKLKFPKDVEINIIIDDLNIKQNQTKIILEKLAKFKSEKRWKDARSCLQQNEKKNSTTCFF